MDEEKLYCKNCGEEVSVYTGFCPKCGTTTKRPAKVKESQKKKKKNNTLIIVIIIIAILAVSVFAVYKFVGTAKIKSAFTPYISQVHDVLGKEKSSTVSSVITDSNTDNQVTITHTEASTATDATATNTITAPKATTPAPAVVSSSTTSAKSDEIIIVIDKKNNCFHADINCSNAKKIEPADKLTTKGTIEQLLAKGYTPCSNCVKTTTAKK